MSRAYVPQPGQRIAVKLDSGVNAAGQTLTATDNTGTIKPKGANRVGLAIAIGSVTGTSPTLDITLQVSYDNGTTWWSLPASANSQTGAAFAQITATGNHVEWYEICSDPEFTQIRAVLTVGGTTPVFPISSAYWITDFVAKG